MTIASVIDRFIGPYEFLNNYYPCEIHTNDGLIFYSSEAYYQACKLKNPKERVKFAEIKDPQKAHDLGKKISLRSDWMIVRAIAMDFVVMEKFYQNAELAQKLIDTNPATLINGNFNNDSYWGKIPVPVGKSNVWYGENHLGQILENLRWLLHYEFGPGSPKEMYDHPPYHQTIDEYIEEQIVEVNSVDWSADDRINSAVDLAWRYGGIDGDHHQKWLVDQMLRQILTPDEYNKFVAKYESNGDYKWERGIAP